MRALATRCLTTACLATLGMLSAAQPAFSQFGPNLSGAGPINRSMGGTAVAAPIDAIGSMYWNPATSSELDNSLDFGLELLAPEASVFSSIPANSFGPGFPPVPLSGTSHSDCGVFPLPSAALIIRPEDSDVTYGLGIFPIAGFGVNYAPSATNPIFTPQLPNGFGLGGVFSELQVMQIAPAITFKLTDRLSIGAGPTVNLALARVDPMFFGSPDDANGDTFPSYPGGGAGSRMRWGGGAQIGLFYDTQADWNFGASLKTKQYFEPLTFNTVDELGNRRNDEVDFELPLIASLGVAYTGIDRLLLAVDGRYLDFSNTDALGESGFDVTGAARGIGLRSIFAISTGAQYLVTDRLAARVGYSFNENPVPDRLSSANVASPVIVQHVIYCGGSYRLTETLSLSASYIHGFEANTVGQYVTPLGAIPGSEVRNNVIVNSFMFGATARL